VRLDCDARESLLIQRANLELLGADDGRALPLQHTPWAGGGDEALEAINLSIRSGFRFISSLARSESLCVSRVHEAVSWPRRGVHALVRTYMTLYERGLLDEACDGLEALNIICTQHGHAFDAEERVQWQSVDAAFPGQHCEGDRLGTATTTRALASACLKMRPAHEHAAKALRWARGLGFPVGPGAYSLTKALLLQGCNVSSEMRAGWAEILSAASSCRSHESPFDATALADFMSLFFEGAAYCVEQRSALACGNASNFAICNLMDPTLMISHQCELLHKTSPILSRILVGMAGEERLYGLGGPQTLACEEQEELERPSHQWLRQQLVQLLSWLVRLRSLYFELDNLVSRAVAVSTNSFALAVRFQLLPHISEYLKMIVTACCKTHPQSTLIDIFTENLAFMKILDGQQYGTSVPTLVKPLAAGILARMRGGYVFELGNHLFLLLKWFAAEPTERKALAIKFGLCNTLKGFGVASSTEGARLARDQAQMCDGTHSGRFVVFALEMLELLAQVDGRPLSWELFADALVAQGGAIAGMSGRQARRSPEVQREARKCCALVRSFSERFRSAEIHEMCARRRKHYMLLGTILDRLIVGLRALPRGFIADGGRTKMEAFASVGDAMPDWSVKDVHEIGKHAAGLAELAVEVNSRVRMAFGGNYHAVVWQRDCYEYDPAREPKDAALHSDNEHQLFRALALLRQVAEALPTTTPCLEGEAPAASPAAPAEAPAALSSGSARGKAKGGGKTKGKKR